MTPPHLTPAQRDELRDELERELTRLQRSMASTAESARPVTLDQTSVGRLSRMDAMANQHMAKDLHQRENALELRLHDALARLAAGTYGQCTRCQAAVPYGRLLAMPEAATCATCGG